jgi:hypothetical protein
MDDHAESPLCLVDSQNPAGQIGRAKIAVHGLSVLSQSALLNACRYVFPHGSVQGQDHAPAFQCIFRTPLITDYTERSGSLI